MFGYLYCKLPMNVVATESAVFSATEATKNNSEQMLNVYCASSFLST